MKMYWGSGATAPSILNLGTRRRLSSQLHAPDTLPPGKAAPILTGQESGWAPEWRWKSSHHCPCRESNIDM